MIRVDEIYNNVFWPWLQQNRPGSRLFFCDPPGNTDTSALFNHGSDTQEENDYIFFHDQEPIHLDIFKPLFDEVVFRNWSLCLDRVPGQHLVNNAHIAWSSQQLRRSFHQHIADNQSPTDFFRDRPQDLLDFKQLNPEYFNIGHVVVSEQGEYCEQLQQQYGWRTHYYFYHGWACQDWFRGYDRTFLIPRARLRRPTKTFMSPNRIVGGMRDHRVLFLYNIFKNNLQHNHISAPRICPYEGVDISVIANKYNSIYPDINQVFESAELPRTFSGEQTQEMHSYQLGNFTEAQDSLVYVPTETVYTGRRQHITEKTFKAIALEMPFVLVAPHHSLEYLRSYGFQTFDPYIDESYDLIEDPVRRIEAVTHVLKDIQARSASAKIALHQQLLSRVEHNYNHFYRGGFADVLWAELHTMLQGIQHV